MFVFPATTSATTLEATPPTLKSFYGRKVPLKDYSDTDPAWSPSATRAKSRGGGKAHGGGKRGGRKAKEAEVFVISSSEDSDEVGGG